MSPKPRVKTFVCSGVQDGETVTKQYPSDSAEEALASFKKEHKVTGALFSGPFYVVKPSAVPLEEEVQDEVYDPKMDTAIAIVDMIAEEVNGRSGVNWDELDESTEKEMRETMAESIHVFLGQVFK